jgi:hypothetical protein
MNRMTPIGLALVSTLGLAAQSAPLDTQARFVKILLTSTGQFGFACNDAALKAKLEALGMAIVEEGGRPQLYVSLANAKASGVAIPDAILKIAKKP